MSGLLSYSGLSTKIRAMQSYFFTDRDYREFSELPSVTQAVSYLKQRPAYSNIFADYDENSLHRGQIEKLLRFSIYMDFAKLYQFSDAEQRKFLKLYFRRYEVILIKTCLNNIFDHRQITLDYSLFREFFRKHSQLNMPILIASTTVEEFVSNLKGTEYYEALRRLAPLEHPTLFDYEMAIDLYYFGTIWKKKDKLFHKRDLAELTRAYGHKFDLLNLQWIYRSKRYYHMSNTDIYALLIPVRYKISTSEIRNLVEADTMDTFEQLIAKTYYGKRYQGFTMDTMEEMYAKIMKYVLSSDAKQDPYSVSVIYSYLYHKEHEVNRLIIALECIRYQIPPDEAMQHIQKT